MPEIKNSGSVADIARYCDDKLAEGDPAMTVMHGQMCPDAPSAYYMGILVACEAFLEMEPSMAQGVAVSLLGACAASHYMQASGRESQILDAKEPIESDFDFSSIKEIEVPIGGGR